MWSFNALRISAMMRWPTYSVRYVLPKPTMPRKTKVARMAAASHDGRFCATKTHTGKRGGRRPVSKFLGRRRAVTVTTESYVGRCLGPAASFGWRQRAGERVELQGLKRGALLLRDGLAPLVATHPASVRTQNGLGGSTARQSQIRPDHARQADRGRQWSSLMPTLGNLPLRVSARNCTNRRRRRDLSTAPRRSGMMGAQRGIQTTRLHGIPLSPAAQVACRRYEVQHTPLCIPPAGWRQSAPVRLLTSASGYPISPRRAPVLQIRLNQFSFVHLGVPSPASQDRA